MKPDVAARTLVLLGGIVTSTACGPGEPITEGQALYEANCGSCHGEQGLGDGPMASGLPVAPVSLLDHLGHHAEDQLVRIIRTGVPPAMPSAALDDDEVRKVIDYAWTLVPDSLVEGLREMQRMAEMGMDMGGGMGSSMEMGQDSGRESSPLGADSAGPMPMDTSRHH